MNGVVSEGRPSVTTTESSSRPTVPVKKSALLSQRSRTFSVHLSTEENYKTKDRNFHGPYAHIRKTLDYGYHKNYRMERQWLQDTIVEEFLDSVRLTDVNGDVCTTPTEPFIVFTAGAMGAGKSHTIRFLVERGLFPLLAFVGVDPDEIRRRLPEFALYADLCPEEAGDRTRKEAGYIVEILTLAALQAGKNVLVDGSLRASGWYTQYFGRLRKEYPNNKIAIIHVVAPRDAVFKRAEERAKRTGRVVPRETLELALEQVPKSVKILAPLADYFCELNNSPGKEIELMTEGEDWDDFQVQWLQTCAWVPGERKKPFSSHHPKEAKRFSVAAMKAVPPKYHIDRQFNVMLSTEENHKRNDMIFCGPYSHIRRTLDYAYHRNYCKERQWLQDMIVKETIATEVEGKASSFSPDPWLVFAAGIMGSGKIHTVKSLLKKGVLPLNGLIIIDRERMSTYLPEFALYTDQHPMTVNDLVRKEVGYISEIIVLAALQAGKNVLVAGTMEDVDWYKEKLFHRLRQDFPVLRIAILHVVAPMPDILSRVAKLFKETGHEVKKEKLEAGLGFVARSVEVLRPLVDYYCKINNLQGTEPTINSEGETWETFQSRWAQSCAWIPGKNNLHSLGVS